jgi:ubiquinone/menaquinone biosynthesis C-methylase UbiE
LNLKGEKMNTEFDAKFWDDRYSAMTHPWDGDPNVRLSNEAAKLAPGTALDVGCGEGSDAIWLAERGWHVTATDISQAALDRGRDAETTKALARPIEWLQADVLTWVPPAASYDLVSVHFIHFSGADRERVYAGFARAVKPRGTLMVVAHHPSDLQLDIGRWPNPEYYFTAEEIAALLEQGQWEILVCAALPRSVDSHGKSYTVHDTVLVARRLE